MINPASNAGLYIIFVKGKPMSDYSMYRRGGEILASRKEDEVRPVH